MLVLKGRNNGLENQYFWVQKSLIVGRSRKCDLTLVDGRTSRQQARFFTGPDQDLWVEDLDSLNGTQCNGVNCSRKRLMAGDVVCMGTTEFLVIPFHTLPKEEQQKIQQGDSDDHVETQYFAKSNIEHELNPSDKKPNDLLQLVDDFDLEDNTEVGKIPEDLGFVEVIDAQIDDAKMIKQVSEISFDGFASKSSSQLTMEELQLHSKQLRVLFDIGILIQKKRHPDSILSGVVERLLSEIGGQYGYVALLNEEGALQMRASREKEMHASDDYIQTKDSNYLLSRSVSRYLLEEKCAVLTQDIRKDLRFSKSKSILMGPSQSLIAAPIVIQDNARGVIAISGEEDTFDMNASLLDFLVIVSSMVGPALENLALIQQRERHLRTLKQSYNKLEYLNQRMISNHNKQLEGMQRNMRLQLNDLFSLYFQDESQSFSLLVPQLSNPHIKKEKPSPTESLIGFHLQGFIQEVFFEYQNKDKPYQLRLYDPKKIFEHIQALTAQDKRFARHLINLRVKSDELPMIKLDPLRMVQAIYCLIKNAVQAIAEKQFELQKLSQPKKDELQDQRQKTLMELDEEEPIIALVGKLSESMLFFEIHDNGIGVSEEITDQIFQKEFSTKPHERLGLGLSICQRITKAHGGSVSCHSIEGKGTVLRIRIPT